MAQIQSDLKIYMGWQMDQGGQISIPGFLKQHYSEFKQSSPNAQSQLAAVLRKGGWERKVIRKKAWNGQPLRARVWVKKAS